MHNRKSFLLAFCFLLINLIPFSASALILDVNGMGSLLGAQNVMVNGASYDVQFLDGSCVDLFTGCDEVSDFFFQTNADANAATAALDDIFQDGAQGNFDTVPGLTRGCIGTTGNCQVWTPFGFRISGFADSAIFQNTPNILDSVVPGEIDPTFDVTLADTIVYAVWSNSATNVSTPSTIALMLFGLYLLRARVRS